MSSKARGRRVRGLIITFYFQLRDAHKFMTFLLKRFSRASLFNKIIFLEDLETVQCTAAMDLF